MEQKLYICRHCGNIIAYVKDAGVPVVCCGERMQELTPNTTDAAQEKHVPVITREGTCVRVAVGSVAHPMTEAHYIEWISLRTEQGVQCKALRPNEAPAAEFHIGADDQVISAMAYCNLHGLWEAKA